jgi:hypothetical protein
MTKKQQRITIAKYCGWKWHSRFKGSIKVWDNGLNYVFYDSDLPDYLNDLNAMRSAEKTLKDLGLYRKFLYLVVLDDPSNVSNEPAWATAAQRAEAFLRTIGKWKTKENKL